MLFRSYSVYSYMYNRSYRDGGGIPMSMAQESAPEMKSEVNDIKETTLAVKDKSADTRQRAGQSTGSLPVIPRSNFSETAFFYPTLLTNEKNEIVFSFTVPDALTRWKFMALAHTKALESGYIEKEVVTQKELMVTSNAPRFFREGDSVFFQIGRAHV